MQMSPVAVLGNAHVAHTHRHSVGGAIEGDGEALRAVGTVHQVAVVAVAQRQTSLIRVDNHLASLKHSGIAAHTSCRHTAHYDCGTLHYDCGYIAPLLCLLPLASSSHRSHGSRRIFFHQMNLNFYIKPIREICGICVSPSWEAKRRRGNLLLIGVCGFEDAVPANALQQWLIGVERDNHKHWSADDVVFWHEAPVARVA